jgi:DNA-binding response OmpR family regulator
MALIVAALVITSTIAVMAGMRWTRRTVRAMSPGVWRAAGQPEEPSGGVMRFGEISVNPAHRTVYRNGLELALRPMEFSLLEYFIGHPEEVHSREELLQAVWHYQPGVSSRTVDVHVFELRRKLERDPERPVHFLTVRKVGYRFRPDVGDGTPPLI